jgi:hypothetical protein
MKPPLKLYIFKNGTFIGAVLVPPNANLMHYINEDMLWNQEEGFNVALRPELTEVTKEYHRSRGFDV